MGVMDWIRRNWPDLLIGVALVLVIAMIIATLLSGGSLLSLVRRDAPPEPQVTTTIGPEDVDGPEAAEVDAPDGADTAASGQAAEGGAADGAEAGAATAIDPFIPEVGDAQTGGAPLLAEDGDDGDTGSGAQTAEDAETTAGDTPSESATTAPETPVPASQTGTFRVAAGAVGSREGADTLAQSYRDLGYTVAVEEQGDLFLLWVGPYENEADAEGAAQGIRDAGGDALVYSFSAPPATDADTATGTDADAPTADGTEEATGAAAAPPEASETAAGVEAVDPAAADETETGAEPAGAATSAVQPGLADAVGEATGDATTEVSVPATAPVTSVLPSAPAGQRYLQVGAFANPTSAEPLHQRLEGLGLSVTRSEAETGLTRLYVGPFGETELTQTQATLTAQGIDSFPVAQ